MEVPLNIIHNYIGFPVLIGLSIDTLRRYKKSHNSTTALFGWATLFGGLACMFFGLPALFTESSKFLSYGTLAGDNSLMISLMFLWIICIRAFFIKKPFFVTVCASVIATLMAAMLIESIHRNLFIDNSTMLVRENGSLVLKYTVTSTYVILNSIHSLSLLLTAIFFWSQGKSAPDSGQKLRIRSVAVGFLLMAAAFIITPTFPVADQAKVSVVLLSSGLAFIGLANLIGPLISRRQAVSKDNSDTPASVPPSSTS